MHRNPAPILATLLLLSLAVAPPALARRAGGSHPAQVWPSAGASIVFAPRFEPTPLPALMAVEEQAISRSMLDLVPFRLPNGAVGIDLQGRFQEFAVASTGPDGKLVIHCVDDADALRRLLATPAASAPATPAAAEPEDR